MALITLGANAITALPSGVGGKVLQVVQTVKTDTTTNNSQSFTDVTGMTVTITPSSASNKILVMSDARFGITTNGSGLARIVRDGTAIYVGDSASSRTLAFYGQMSDENRRAFNFVTNFLDSPNTTSAVIYKLQSLTQSSGVVMALNKTINDTDTNYDGRFASSITVMEIAS
jgi:hypothetical protein